MKFTTGVSVPTFFDRFASSFTPGAVAAGYRSNAPGGAMFGNRQQAAPGAQTPTMPDRSMVSSVFQNMLGALGTMGSPARFQQPTPPTTMPQANASRFMPAQNPFLMHLQNLGQFNFGISPSNPMGATGTYR